MSDGWMKHDKTFILKSSSAWVVCVCFCLNVLSHHFNHGINQRDKRGINCCSVCGIKRGLTEGTKGVGRNQKFILGCHRPQELEWKWLSLNYFSVLQLQFYFQPIQLYKARLTGRNTKRQSVDLFMSITSERGTSNCR